MKCEDCPYAIPCYGDKLSGDPRKFSYCPVCGKCVLYERKMLTPEEIAKGSTLNPNFMTTNGAEKSNEQYGAIWAEGEYIDCELRYPATEAFLQFFIGPNELPLGPPSTWTQATRAQFKNTTLQTKDPGPSGKDLRVKICDVCKAQVDTINIDLERTMRTPLNWVDIQLNPPEGMDVEAWAQACKKGLKEIAKKIEEEEEE